MRLALGLGLLLIAVAAIPAAASLAWAHAMFSVGVAPRVVLGLIVVVAAASGYFGARLTFASIRAAAERQAEAIRRM